MVDAKKPQKSKRITNTSQVLKYLKEVRLACSTQNISKATGLELNKVRNALAGLRKKKLIGLTRSYWGDFGAVQQKSYWGIK